MLFYGFVNASGVAGIGRSSEAQLLQRRALDFDGVMQEIKRMREMQVTTVPASAAEQRGRR